MLKTVRSQFSMAGRMVAMSPEEDGLIGIPFSEHSNELLYRLNAQRRSGLLCDLTLTSRGARYPTHRAVMAAVSLYFRQLFGAEEVGGTDEVGMVGEGCSVCQLDCVSPEALDALLEFAYTATLTIRSSDMRAVLEGAQLLGIECVADVCRHILGEVGEDKTNHIQKQQRAPSRRKPDRRSVGKTASPVQPAWRKTQSEENMPKYTATPENTPHLIHREPEHSVQEGELTNGGHPSPQQQKEPIIDKKAGPQCHALSQAEKRVGGDTEGVTKKRKSQMPQQCPVCHKIIHGAGKLPRHMRTHTGEKPFQCSTCGVRFTRNDKLKIHTRKHTGERPYSCPSCPARFLHSYDLKNHQSLHSGTRPYECSLCHKAFAREDHLQRHRKGLACLELCPRLELRSRRACHPSSPHSPHSPTILPSSSTTTATHFQFHQELINSVPSLISGGMMYSSVPHWKAIKEDGEERAACGQEKAL